MVFRHLTCFYALDELNCFAKGRIYQDIVNAVSFLGTTKIRLQAMRNQACDSMFKMVNNLCLKYDIRLSDMNVMHIPRGLISKRKAQTNGISNMNYNQRIMYVVIDLLCLERMTNLVK